MQDLRARPLTEIAGTAVVLRKDNGDGVQTDVAAGTVA